MSDLVRNKRASYDYELLDIFEAGLVLVGTEVKSLREHQGSLQEAYIKVVGQETFLIGATIFAYKFGNVHNHDEKRDRKLLLHKREILALKKATQEKGLTIVPLALYLKKGKVKLKLAIGRGKKAHDKRAHIKEKEDKKRAQRAMKEHAS